MNEVVTTEPAKPLSPLQRVYNGLVKMDDKLRELLPENITPARFRQVVMTAIENKPDLLDADPRTLFLACRKAAEMGLMPDGREGAIVVRKVKIDVTLPDGRKITERVPVATFQPMYIGIIAAVHKSATVAAISAHVVYEGEEFEVMLGDNENIHHKRDINLTEKKIVAAYCIITLRNTVDGTASMKLREAMSRAQIEKVRNSGSAAEGPFWKNWYDQMAIKTVIRRHSKKIPWSAEDKGDMRARAAIEAVDGLYNFESDRAQRAARERQELEEVADLTGESKEDLPTSFGDPGEEKAPPAPKTDSKVAFINAAGERLVVPSLQDWKANWLAMIAQHIRAMDLGSLRDAWDRNKATMAEVHTLGPWAVTEVEAALRKALDLPEPTVIEGTLEKHPEDETREQEIARENAEREEAERLAAARAKAAEEHGKRPLSDSMPGGAKADAKPKAQASNWAEVPYLGSDGFPLAGKNPKEWKAGLMQACAEIGNDHQALRIYLKSMEAIFQSMADSGNDRIIALRTVGEMLIKQAIERADAAYRAQAGEPDDAEGEMEYPKGYGG